MTDSNSGWPGRDDEVSGAPAESTPPTEQEQTAETTSPAEETARLDQADAAPWAESVQQAEPGEQPAAAASPWSAPASPYAPPQAEQQATQAYPAQQSYQPTPAQQTYQAGQSPVAQQPTRAFPAQHSAAGYQSPQGYAGTTGYPGGQPAAAAPGSAPYQGTGAHSAYGTSYQAGQGYQSGSYQPGAQQQPTPSYPGSGSYAQPQQPSAPPSYSPAPVRERRRGPGWPGVIITGVLAAALASGASFGISRAVLNDDPAAAQSQKPITGSSSVDGAPNWTAVAATASKSVVAIQVGQNGQLTSQGSGFVFDASGHILTNNHVVAPGAGEGGEVNVVFNNGDTYAATIVGRDPESDIGVLKIANPPKGLVPLPAGASSDLKVGDPVMALGNPLGLADTVTTGIVSALNRPVTTVNESEDGSDAGSEVVTNAVQTDAAVNPGNSGGPLINARGEVIGITSSIAGIPQAGQTGQSGSIGIGFAIPMESAKIIADQLVKSGKAQHPYLGITLNSSTVKLDGVERGSASVVDVVSGTAADKAGLRKGDNVIAINGTAVNSGESLQALVRANAVGSTVKMTVVRDGKQQDINVTLQAKP